MLDLLMDWFVVGAMTLCVVMICFVVGLVIWNSTVSEETNSEDSQNLYKGNRPDRRRKEKKKKK